MTVASQLTNQIIKPLTAVLTVANNATTTAAVSLFGTTALAILVPASLVSTSISFLVSVDNVTFYPLKNSDGSLYTLSGITSAAAAFPLVPYYMAGWRYLKVVCGSAESVNKTFPIIPFSV